MFKKILNKIKSAAKWVADKVKSMAEKAKGWYKKHKETVDQFAIGALAGTLAVGAAICVANAMYDPNYVPPTREEKLREMGDFWDKYSNLRTAKASRIITNDADPLRELTDPSGRERLSILEFDKGYWIDVNGDWSDEEQITLDQLGDVGKIIKDSFKMSTDSDDISGKNMIDNIFIMAEKDKLKLDGVEVEKF